MKSPLWRRTGERVRFGPRAFRAFLPVLLFASASYLSLKGVSQYQYRVMLREGGYLLRDNGYELRLPQSELGVTEWGGDTTGDGLIDTWSVSIGYGDLEVNFWTEDLNADGHGDTVEIGLGEDYRCGAFVQAAYDEAKREDYYHVVCLRDHENPDRCCYYSDFDFDGAIDTMEKTTEDGKKTVEIRVGRKWLPAKQGENAKEFRVVDEDGQEGVYAYDPEANSFVPQE
jgi:hypothetical protein